MASSYPSTHDAVVAPAKRAQLTIQQFPTAAPGPGEVVVRVEWTASSPLNLHQADGALGSPQYPFILGDTFTGTVVAAGPVDSTATQTKAAPIQVGDQVTGFTWEKQRQAGFQTYVTVPQHLMGRIPSNLSMEQAATVPSSLITVFHTIGTELGLEIPWPKPSGWAPRGEHQPFLIWGAASSVGLYFVQVLKHWGYKNILAVSSRQHHEQLLKYGATRCFDYNEGDVTEQINAVASSIPHIIDCIGLLEGTLRPLGKIASRGTRVAIMLPVILQDASDELEPELTLDPTDILRGVFADGVDLIGVRTFFYEKNTFFKRHLQPDILPSLLESGIVEASKTWIVEGSTLLERAQKALDLLRQRAPRGERLVWKVAEKDCS